MTNLSRTLILGCSVLALSACGPEEIVSPGTGGNVTINNITNNPAPTPTPTPTPTTALVTAAFGCPVIPDQDNATAGDQGLVDEGTITGPEGTWRVCAMPARFIRSASLTRVPGLLYRLPGRVDVGTDGGPAPDASDGLTDSLVTLTIAPGVIVYASGSAFLNVNRGSKISAIGSATRPIIFTSRDNVNGINNADSSGQWGGIVLSGRAQLTDCQDANAPTGTVQCQRQVEGATDPALFGGATNADNSGSLRFVQIRYSGFVLSGDAELQSLTTGGTGSGTVLDHIQSVNSSDDGVEFFGGNVNIKNLIVAGAEDDGLDMDVGAKLNIQYVLTAQRAGVGDSTIESDTSRLGALDNLVPRTATKISNATFIHRRTGDQVLRIRGGSDMNIANSLVWDNSSAGTPCLRVDDAATIQTAGDDELGVPVFSSFGVQCATRTRNGSNSGATATAADLYLTGGTGNNVSYVNTLTGGYLNGASENNFAPIFNATTFSSFFVATTFIGAVTSTDNWTQGWTCDSAAVSFGGNTGSCLALPVFPAS